MRFNHIFLKGIGVYKFCVVLDIKKDTFKRGCRFIDDMDYQALLAKAKKEMPAVVQEKQRFEILLEDVHKKLQLLSEGQEQLRSEMHEGFQQDEFRENQRFDVVEQALKENSQDMKELRQEVHDLVGRVTAHEETHAK